MNDINNHNNVNKDQSSEVGEEQKKIDQSEHPDKEQPETVNNNTANEISVKEDVVMNTNASDQSKSLPAKDEDMVKLYQELERYKREKQRYVQRFMTRVKRTKYLENKKIIFSRIRDRTTCQRYF